MYITNLELFTLINQNKPRIQIMSILKCYFSRLSQRYVILLTIPSCIVLTLSLQVGLNFYDWII